MEREQIIMSIGLNVTGLDKLIASFAYANTALRRAVQTGLVEHAQDTAENLATAAPKGQGGSGGPPPAGDAPGRLSESFSGVAAGMNRSQVRTSQPTKLTYVTQGTGLYGPRGQKITPRVKKALMWEAADHPYRSVKGIKPNPFVDPILAAARDSFSAKMNETVRAALQALGL